MNYKQSAFGLVFVLLSFQTLAAENGSVLLVSGMSSVGKTSTVAELQKIDESIIVDGTDKVTLRSYSKYLQEFAPKKYELIAEVFGEENITYDIVGTSPEPLDGVSREKLAKALETLESLKRLDQRLIEQWGGPDAYDKRMDDFYGKLLVQAVIDNINKGDRVVLDVLSPDEIKDALEDAGIKESVKIVLLYVPFNKYLARLEKRNALAFELGEKLELREPLDMFSYFGKLFKVQRYKAKPWQRLSRLEARRTLEAAAQGSMNLYRRAGEAEAVDGLKKEKDFLIDSILYSIGFGFDIETGYLVPKVSFDMSIDTSKHSPKEVAAKVHAFFVSDN